jgi:hypothetical protein
MLAGSKDEAPALLVLPAFITFDAKAASNVEISAERVADRMVVASKVNIYIDINTDITHVTNKTFTSRSYLVVYICRENDCP